MLTCYFNLVLQNFIIIRFFELHNVLKCWIPDHVSHDILKLLFLSCLIIKRNSSFYFWFDIWRIRLLKWWTYNYFESRCWGMCRIARSVWLWSLCQCSWGLPLQLYWWDDPYSRSERMHWQVVVTVALVYPSIQSDEDICKPISKRFRAVLQILNLLFSYLHY